MIQPGEGSGDTGGEADPPLSEINVLPSTARAHAISQTNTIGIFVGPTNDPDRFELFGPGLQGGEGIIWRGHYRGSLDKPVTYAIKQLLQPPGSSPTWPSDNDVRRWNDQLFVLRGIRNTHLVTVNDIFFGPPPHQPKKYDNLPEYQEFRNPYLVMEWVDGPTLGEAVTQGSEESLTEFLGYVRDIAEAIDTLHSRTQTSGNPMLHGDIKPENCIVNPNHGAVLVDFGTLRRFDDSDDARSLYTRRYAAPEVLADLRALRTPSSDLYSLGAVAYYCIVGADPPVASEREATDQMRTELTSAATHRHGVTEVAQFVNLTMKMLNPDPAARPTRPIRWAQEIQRLAAGSRSTSDDASATGKRPFRDRRRTLVIAGTTALVLLSGTFAALTNWENPPEASIATSEGFEVFGDQWADFSHSTQGDRLSIEPPMGENRYDHLWGFHRAGNFCAATVEFDVQVGEHDDTIGFGFAVAPRSALESQQPTGYSVQYEWQPGGMNPAPGTYIRPAELPGGAWRGTADPKPAPDIRTRRQVRVETIGASLGILVDETKIVEYQLPRAECGGVSIRVWGAPFTFSNVRIGGT